MSGCRVTEDSSRRGREKGSPSGKNACWDLLDMERFPDICDSSGEEIEPSEFKSQSFGDFPLLKESGDMKGSFISSK